MKQATHGQKVRDNYDEVHEVRGQIGTTVYLTDGSWIHRTKCWLLDARGRVDDAHSDSDPASSS